MGGKATKNGVIIKNKIFFLNYFVEEKIMSNLLKEIYKKKQNI